MLLIAAFVAHPSTLGWIGLAVASALALAIGVGVTMLFPRLRAAAEWQHPHPTPAYRLLVVLDVEPDADELCSAVGLRLLGRRGEVRVTAPVLATPLHYLTTAEDNEALAARARLRSAVEALAEIGVHAEGIVGPDDPLQAVGDALAGFHADEILLVAPLSTSRGWLDARFERQARDLYDIPVSTVFASARRLTAVSTTR